MAHVLLEKMLAERDARGRVLVRSGGIANHARDGMIPSLDARIVLREHDLAGAGVGCHILALVASEVGADRLHTDPDGSRCCISASKWWIYSRCVRRSLRAA